MLQTFHLDTVCKYGLTGHPYLLTTLSKQEDLKSAATATPHNSLHGSTPNPRCRTAEDAVGRGVQKLVTAQSSVTFNDVWGYSQRARSDGSTGEGGGDVFPTTATAALAIKGQRSPEMMSARPCSLFPRQSQTRFGGDTESENVSSHVLASATMAEPTSGLVEIICGSAAVALTFCIGGFCVARRRASLAANATPSQCFGGGCTIPCVAEPLAATPRRELLLAEAVKDEEVFDHSPQLKRGLPPPRPAVTTKKGTTTAGGSSVNRYAASAGHAAFFTPSSFARPPLDDKVSWWRR